MAKGPGVPIDYTLYRESAGDTEPIVIEDGRVVNVPKWLVQTLEGIPTGHENKLREEIRNESPKAQYIRLRDSKGFTNERGLAKIPPAKKVAASNADIMAGRTVSYFLVRYDGSIATINKSDFKKVQKAIPKGTYFPVKIIQRIGSNDVSDENVTNQVSKLSIRNNKLLTQGLNQLPHQLRPILKSLFDTGEVKAYRPKYDMATYQTPLKGGTGFPDPDDPYTQYPDGEDIPSNLPSNYDLASNPDNESCQNCVHYEVNANDPSLGSCHLWDAGVRGKYICNRWAPQ